MSKRLLLVGIISLVVILAGSLGYYFYTQTQNSGKKTPADLSFPDENSLLAYMDVADRSDELRAKFFAALEVFAKSGDLITVKSCRNDPIALKVKSGSTIMIKNADQIDYELRISTPSLTVVSVPAERIVNLKFDFVVGSYGIRCSGTGYEKQPAAGYIYVAD